MKNITNMISRLNYISILMAGLMVISCRDGFLDYEPVDEITTADYFSTVDDFVSFINGAYNEIDFDEGAARTWIEAGNHPAGDFVQHHDMENNEIWDPNFRTTSQMWEYNYRVFNKMNTVMSFLTNLEDDEERVRVEAEARFLRGFSLLMLYRYYGPVAITPVPDASNPTQYPRNTEEETVAQIMEDLNYAVAELPETWNGFDDYEIGRPLKGSALGFRMLLNAYLEDWNAVITDFQAIEASSRGYGLVADYRDLYHTKKENSIESLFEIQFLGGLPGVFGRAQNGHWLNEVTIPRRDSKGGGNKWSTYGGWGQWHISTPFVNSFEAGDTRRNLIIGVGDKYVGEYFAPGDTIEITAEDYAPGSYGTTKYFTGPEFQQGVSAGSSLNIHVMRFADAIFLYAEALAKTGNISGAYQQLNRVRNRAGIADKSGSGLSEFMEDLTLERRHEGFAEINVWPELVRTGYADDVMLEHGVSMDPAWEYLPIPMAEILANPLMKQNDGY